MSDYKERVVGIVMDAKGPLERAEVKVFDKDILFDDALGTATTDNKGQFQVDFRWSDYKDGPFEDTPDFYVEVKTKDDRKLKSGVNYRPEGQLEEDDSLETFDLGTVIVG